MKNIVAVFIPLMLAGCLGRPQQEQQVTPDFKVSVLFTHDGCTVYRFTDGGSARYFTNCKGSTTWRESAGGKGQTRAVGVEGGE